LILVYGDVSKLAGNNWFLLEIRSERTAENIIRRIGNAIPNLIRSNGACEVFLPIGNRDLNGYTLKTASYLFIRTTEKQDLVKFRSITGVLGLLCSGDQQRLDRALSVDDEYVQGLIQECETAFYEGPSHLKVGSFVRILDGLDRGFCGVIQNIDRDYAMVLVELKTRKLFIETPLHNLRDLSDVPQDQRVFYYAPVVQAYAEEFGEEASIMLEKDLAFACPICDKDEGESFSLEEKKTKFGRQRTVTAIAKRLIYEGNRDVKDIVTTILAEIKSGNIKRPKSVFILYFVLKQLLIKELFHDDPDITTYKDVISKYGPNWELSPSSIKEMDTESLIPTKSAKSLKLKKRKTEELTFSKEQ